MEELLQKRCGDPKSMSPVALAFLGDGVYELMVRERLVQNGALPAGKLHLLAVRRVKATAQAAAYGAVSAACNPQELDILRRGRNVSLSRMPRSCTPEEYHKATAIEALFGYLYLCGDTRRLHTLFDLMEETSGHGESQNPADSR